MKNNKKTDALSKTTASANIAMNVNQSDVFELVCDKAEAVVEGELEDIAKAIVPLIKKGLDIRKQLFEDMRNYWAKHKIVGDAKNYLAKLYPGHPVSKMGVHVVGAYFENWYRYRRDLDDTIVKDKELDKLFVKTVGPIRTPSSTTRRKKFQDLYRAAEDLYDGSRHGSQPFPFLLKTEAYGYINGLRLFSRGVGEPNEILISLTKDTGRAMDIDIFMTNKKLPKTVYEKKRAEYLETAREYWLLVEQYIMKTNDLLELEKGGRRFKTAFVRSMLEKSEEGKAVLGFVDNVDLTGAARQITS